MSLATAGHEVFLVTSHHENLFQKGIQVIGVGKPKNRWERLFFTVPKVLWAGLKADAKIFHLHDPELLVLVPILRCLGKKVIYDIHEDYVTSIALKGYLPKWLRASLANFFSIFERMFAYFCYQVIAEKYYIERFPQALAVLNYPNAIDRSNSSADILQKLKSLSSTYRWFFYSGNITEDRGAMHHLELLRFDPKAALFMIGKCSADLYKKIEESMQSWKIEKSRCVIVGVGKYVAKEDIDTALMNFPWMAGLALFPYSQHYERKELTKFFEYIQGGLPILAADFTAWQNLIDGEHLGSTVKVGDEASVHQALQQIASARGNSDKIKDQFRWETQAKILLGLYQRIEPDCKAKAVC